MKQKIKKWTLLLMATGLLCLGLLVGMVLNPTLLYAHKSIVGNYTIYHNTPLDKYLILRLNDAAELIKTSELYNSDVRFEICLNDGSWYPSLIQKLQGQAFAWGFYNKVVLNGNLNCKDNYVLLNGYKWNLTQLIAHEETHCLQFYKFGFWKSNPIASIPKWKWEGYAEYIARQNQDQKDLSKNIARLNKAIKRDSHEWGISFTDSTFAAKEYFNYWLLNQYCLDIKKMTYVNLVIDTTGEQTRRQQMMNWYEKQ